MDQATKNFWIEMQRIGEEVLQQGKEMGFGMSLVEIKFQDGTPSVITRSISVNTLYPDNNTALQGVAKELNESVDGGFDGARTFTVVFNHGKIRRVLQDEYSNRMLK